MNRLQGGCAPNTFALCTSWPFSQGPCLMLMGSKSKKNAIFDKSCRHRVDLFLHSVRSICVLFHQSEFLNFDLILKRQGYFEVLQKYEIEEYSS